jgi:hypothetical protein
MTRLACEGEQFNYSQTQPDNIHAMRIGKACQAASKHLCGDLIDRGLGLLQELEKLGYAITRLNKINEEQLYAS